LRVDPARATRHSTIATAIQFNRQAPRASKSAASVTASSPKGEMLREMEKRSGSCNSATGTGKGTVGKDGQGDEGNSL